MLDIVYLLLLLLASPWLLFRAWTTGRYREGLSQKLWGAVPILPPISQPTLWLHAVSVGEVNLLPILVSRLEKTIPGVRCVISTTTKTGMEVAKKRFENYTVFYFPLDFSWAVKRAINRIKPTAIILAELEVWPNLTRFAQNAGVKLIVANGRISDKSFQSYRRAKFFLRSAFKRVDKVISQSKSVSDKFIELGVAPENVITIGSIKFDGAKTDRNSAAVCAVKKLSGSNTSGDFWAGISEQDIVFLAGSTQDPEEKMALDAFNSLTDTYPQLRLIIVPRHPERFESVAEMLSENKAVFVKRTDLNSETTADSTTGRPAKILLVNAMGELSAWWGTCHIAFVGGSMGSRGGQNMIEPAAYGAAVSFGPQTSNFRDIVSLLLEAQAAKVVQDGTQLQQFVAQCLANPDQTAAIGQRAQNLVLSQQGAADKTVEIIVQTCF